MSLEELVSAAEEKTEQAVASRDTLLADIDDESTKAKAKLLADAAIAGVKVKKVAMALTAESDDAACTQAFSKMQLNASLGACDVTDSASRRRRLVAETSYNVTVYVSPVTVDTTTLAAALENLAALDIIATSTEIDPTEELRAIPGIDATSLDTFVVDVAAAADASSVATDASSEVPSPPPGKDHFQNITKNGTLIDDALGKDHFQNITKNDTLIDDALGSELSAGNKVSAGIKQIAGAALCVLFMSTH